MVLMTNNTEKVHKIAVGREVVFKNVDLEYQKGKNNTTAVIGASGSGKTYICTKIVDYFGNMDPSASIYVIDLFGEYDRNAHKKESMYKESLKKYNLDVISLDGSADELSNEDKIGNKVRFTIDRSEQVDPRNNGEIMTNCLKAIWKKINSVKNDTLKIVFVDEAWFLHQSEEGFEALETIIRMGRKLNTVVIFNTQGYSGLPENIRGNCETCIFLRLTDDVEDMEILRSAGLDDSNIETLKTADMKTGLILKSGEQTQVMLD